MTKLEAVNQVLRGAGMAPVGSLDTNGASRAADAERYLEQWEREVQSTGWHYNRRRDVTLSPDSNGRIPVPDSAFFVDTYIEDAYIDVTVKGGFLYRLDENTDVFTRSVKTEQILRFEFGCIPEPIQRYIVACAAEEFNSAYGRPELRQYRRKDVADSKARADRFNQRGEDANMLTTNESLRTKGGPRYSGRRFFGGLPYGL